MPSSTSLLLAPVPWACGLRTKCSSTAVISASLTKTRRNLCIPRLWASCHGHWRPWTTGKKWVVGFGATIFLILYGSGDDSIYHRTSRNLLEPFLGNGLTVHASAFRSADKQLAIVPYVGQNFDSPFPHPLLIPQVQTEYFLEDALCKASQNDSIVERNVMLLGYEENQDTNEVVARLARRTPEGEPWEEVVRARYIVGCDGVHSTVRKGVAGWLFEGETIAIPLAVVI